MKSDPSQQVRETTTDTNGHFRFAGLIWGAYALDLSAPGWQSNRSEFELRSNTTLFVTTALSPANSEQSAHNKLVGEDVWFGSQFGDLAIHKLPNGRDIWSILQNLEPSTATNRFEIAGLETATPALFGALGASWTENEYLFNGLNVTDPYLPGLPLINPGIDALSEFQAVTASKPALFQGSGEEISLASPRSDGSLHGGVWLFGSGGPLQSDNMEERLRLLGFPGPERLNSLLDASAQIGGKLPASLGTMPLFVSLSTQQVSQDLGGFAAPINSGVNRVLVNLTPWSRGSQRLNLLYGGQHVFNSAQGATPEVAPSATTRGNDNFDQFQAQWTQSFGTTKVFSASFGAVNAIVASDFQPEVQGVSRVDLPLMTYSGPAPLATSGGRTNYEAQSLWQSISNVPWGSHSLSVGFDWERSDITNRWYDLSALEVLVDSAPSELIDWNTPAQAQQHVQNVAAFVQDSWRPWKWLILPIGLRIDISTGRADGAANGIRWTTLEPRLGFVVPLWSPGLVLQGSWSRYGQLLQGLYLDYGNPSALGGEVFQKAAGSGVPPGTLLRVFGGSYSAISPNLARPYTDEITFGLQKTVPNRWTASLRFFDRYDYHRIGLENTGVPFSDYTPVQETDPGNDQVLTLYNEKPSALGHDFLLLTNPAGLHSSFQGFEIRYSAHVHSIQFSASFTASQAMASTSPGNSPFENDTGFVGSLGTNPNTLLFAQGRTYFDRAFTAKVSAYYQAPHGFYLAMVAPYFDGAPFGRLLFVDGFNQGPFFVRATPVGEPGGFRTEHNATIDVRLARDFHLPLGVLTGYADVFNIMNWNSSTEESALTGPDFALRVPLAIEAPRTIRLGIAWKF